MQPPGRSVRGLFAEQVSPIMEDKVSGKERGPHRPPTGRQNSDDVENLPSVSQGAVPARRQALRTIQNSAQQGTLVGRPVQKGKRKLERHEWLGDSKVQKTASQLGSRASEAQQLMVHEPASVSYWAQLAEQRRKALEETLLENERLNADLALKETELIRLQTENEELAELAAQASYLAGVVEVSFVWISPWSQRPRIVVAFSVVSWVIALRPKFIAKMFDICFEHIDALCWDYIVS
uniref:Geminin n=1 Tax=Eptatretus burgeri TaxID=7764 RepID=A0A8C4QW89_EPTBU